jgi:hypothetical protein
MKRLTEVVDDEAAVAEPARGAAEEGAALGEREVVPHRGHGPAGVRVGVPEREHHGAARARRRGARARRVILRGRCRSENRDRDHHRADAAVGGHSRRHACLASSIEHVHHCLLALFERLRSVCRMG